MIKATIWFPEDLEFEEIHTCLPCAPNKGDRLLIDPTEKPKGIKYTEWLVEQVNWNFSGEDFDWIDVDLVSYFTDEDNASVDPQI